MADARIMELNGHLYVQKLQSEEMVSATIHTPLSQGDTLILEGKGTVEININGELHSLVPGQPFVVNLTESENNTLKNNPADDNADLPFMDALAGDGDILDALEETAAGLDGGSGSDGGNNFIRVARIQESTDPVSFEFDKSSQPRETFQNTQENASGSPQPALLEITLDIPDTTNDTTPVLIGTSNALPGATISIYVTDSEGNNQQLFATIENDGSFSVEVPSPLTEGQYSVEAATTSSTGDSAQTSAQALIDITPPQIFLNPPGTGLNATPTFSGSTDAPAGSVVSLQVTDALGETQLLTTVVIEDGSFETEPAEALSEGDYIVQAEVTDSAGNSAIARTEGTLDTVTPALTLNLPDISGDTTPDIAGVSDAPVGSIVTLIVVDNAGGSQSFQASVDESGQFSTNIPEPLAEGQYSVEATISDQAGNITTVNAGGVIDITPPSLTLNPPGENSDGTPFISGASDAPSGTTVFITVTDAQGGQQLLTAVVQQDGDFSTDVTEPPADGSYTVIAEVSDDVGNTQTAGTSGEYTSARPVITLDEPGLTNDATPLLTGSSSVSPGSTVSITLTQSDGAQQTITTSIDDDGTFSAQVTQPVSDGTFAVTAEVIPPVGPSATTTTSGEIDTVAPSLVLNSPGSSKDTQPTFTGSSDMPEGTLISLQITDAADNRYEVTTTVDTAGEFSVTAPSPLEEGEFTVTATIEDKAGNRSQSSTEGAVNLNGPSVSITEVITSDGLNIIVESDSQGASVIVVVTGQDGSSQSSTLVTDDTGQAQISFPDQLSDGTYEIEVSVTDSDGNTSEAGTTVTIDNTPPSLSLTPQEASNDTSPTISGTTGLLSGSVVTLNVTDSQGSTVEFEAQVESGRFSESVPSPLSEGPFTVTAYATDESGNTSTVTDNSGLIDTTPPQLDINPQPVTNDTTPAISGTTDLPAETAVSVLVTDSSGTVQTLLTHVTETGTFSVNVVEPLDEGKYTVEVSATDIAGNQVVVNAESSVDITAPTLTVSLPDTTSDATPTIFGETDMPPGSQVEVVVTDSAGNIQLINAMVNEAGEFTATVNEPLSEGDFVVNVSGYDEAGNKAETELTAAYTPAAFQLTIDPLPLTNDTTPVLTGTTNLPENTEVAVTITDSQGNTQSSTARVADDGTFSVTPTIPLSQGDFTVTASAPDDSGNTVSTTRAGGSIDTTPPAITITPQAPISDATPEISGTTDLPAQSIVFITVKDNNDQEQHFQATIHSDGTYAASPPGELAEGAYAVTVTASDGAGNTSTVTDSQGSVDTQPPQLSIDPPGDGNDATPLLSGISDASQGSEVIIKVVDNEGVQQVITTTVNEQGRFSAKVSQPLAEGEYSVEVAVSDNAGNTTTAIDNSGSIDLTPPQLFLDPLPQGNDTTPDISGGTDLPEGAVLSVQFEDAEGNQQIVSTIISKDGRFNAFPDTELAEGNYTVTVTAVDSTGNTSVITENSYINSIAPEIYLDSQSATNDTTPLISGGSNATAGTVVTLTVTDSAGASQQITTAVQPDGTFGAAPDSPLAEGQFTVEALITDADGNEATTLETGGKIDTTPPSLNLSPIPDTNDPLPIINGMTDAPESSIVLLTVIDALGQNQTFLVPINNDGSFSVGVREALAEGEFKVEAELSDDAGNTSVQTITGVLDITPPVISLNEPGISADNTPLISGTTDATAGSNVTIQVTDASGSTYSFTAVVANDTTFSAQVPQELEDGSFSVIAEVQDAAGNVATVSTNGKIDTLPPSLSVEVEEPTNDPTPLITGVSSEPPGTQVQVIVTDSSNTSQSITASVQPDGAYSVKPVEPLSEGPFSIVATISDEAANETSASVNSTLDTSPPLLTITPIDVTNDTTPEISGTTDVSVGTLVLVTVTSSSGIEQTLSAVVQANGTWSTDVPLPISEGEFTVTAQVFDEASNIVTVSANAELDTTAPIISIDQSGIIKVTTPEISGSVNLEEGSQVIVTLIDSNANSQVLSAIVDAFGQFAVKAPEPLAEGLITIQVDATDPAGNSAVTTKVIELDLTAPGIILDIAPVIASDTPVISGVTDAAEGSPVTITISQHGQVIASIDTQVLAGGTFNSTVPVALTEGTANIKVTINDGVESSVSTDVEVDLTAPLLTLDNLNVSNDPSPIISGHCNEPGAWVTITVTDSSANTYELTALVQPDGSFTAGVPQNLPEGTFTVSANVSDAAGNNTSVSSTATIDTTPPELFLSPVSFDSLTPTIAGTSEAGALLTIVFTDCYGATLTVNTAVLQDGTFSVIPPASLPQGKVTIDLLVTDAAGNISDMAVSGVINVTLPLIALDPIQTDSLTPTISGISERIGEKITITLTDGNGAVSVLTSTVSVDGTFEVLVTDALSQGALNVLANVNDENGNPASVESNVIIDITLPPLSLDSLVLNSLTPVLSGISESIGEIVTLTLTDGTGAVQVLTTVVQNNGEFEINVPVDLSQGLLSVEASVLGNDGNLVTVISEGVLDISLPLLHINSIDGTTLTPVITGVSKCIGSEIELTLTDALGGVHVLTALVQNDGAYSVSVPHSLPEGLLTVEASVIDDKGTLVTAEVSGLINISLAELSVELVNLDSASPAVNGVSYYIGKTVSIVGTDSSGLSETITTTIANDGTYTGNFTSSFADGLLSLDVTVLDDDYSTLASVTTSGIIDVYLPELSLGALNFDVASPTISGTSQFIGETVQVSLIDIHGNTQTLDTVVGNAGAFELIFTELFSDGLLSVDAAVIDTADNSVTLASLSTSGVIGVNLTLLEIDKIDTSTTTPVISGTSERIGETVTITLLDAKGTQQLLSAVVQSDGTFNAMPATPVCLGDLVITAGIPDRAGDMFTVTATELINLPPAIQVTSFDTLGDGAIFGTVAPEYAGYELTVTLNVELLGAVNLPISAQTSLIQSDGSFEIIGVGLDANVLGLPIASVDISIAMLDAAGNLVTVNSTADSKGNITSGDPEPTLEDTVSATSINPEADVVTLPSAKELSDPAFTSDLTENNQSDLYSGSRDVIDINKVTPTSAPPAEYELNLEAVTTDSEIINVDYLVSSKSVAEEFTTPTEASAQYSSNAWENDTMAPNTTTALMPDGPSAIDY